MPWAVNTLALVAGGYIMDKLVNDNSHIKQILSASKLLQHEVSKLDDCHVIPSGCNYFLVRIKSGNAKELQHYLVQEHGILIRNAANFRGLGNSWIRIASQGTTMDKQLIIAMKKWLKR